MATRYASVGEKACTTINTFLRRVQGLCYAANCQFRNLSTLYIDRGYLSYDIIALAQKAGLHIGGIMKNCKQNPFTFGGEKQIDGVKKLKSLVFY